MIPDGYQLIDPISRTAFAQVWLSSDPSGTSVVLKLASDDDRVQRRFKREIEALKSAAGPHVMPVLEFDESYSWYSMPVAARTLNEVDVPTSFDEAVLVLKAITAALAPIHALGQVHRDLKPQNILWLDDGRSARWVVADFGIVRNAPGATTQELTRIDGLTGSQGWAAPEQYRDAHVSAVTADVFGAGGVMSWMLTGRRPSFGDVALPEEPRLRAVIRRATDPTPNSRYRDLEEFLANMQRAANARLSSLDSLFDMNDWSGVSEYVLSQTSQLPRVATSLPRLTQPTVRDWYVADAGGLVSAVTSALDELVQDAHGLNYTEIDRFLNWGVLVLRVFTHSRDYENVERIATALFRAIAGINQFKPARVALDWMSGLDQNAQRVVESSLHRSASYDFFSAQAKDRWPSGRTSELVLRLMEE